MAHTMLEKARSDRHGRKSVFRSHVRCGVILMMGLCGVWLPAWRAGAEPDGTAGAGRTWEAKIYGVVEEPGEEEPAERVPDNSGTVPVFPQGKRDSPLPKPGSFSSAAHQREPVERAPELTAAWVPEPSLPAAEPGDDSKKVPAAAPAAVNTNAPQRPGKPRLLMAQRAEGARPAAPADLDAQADALVEWIKEPGISLAIDPRRSKILRTKQPVTKVSVTDPQVLEIVQFSPTEFELIGGSTGETSLTFWFGDPDRGGQMLRYLVQVSPNEAIEDRRQIEYTELERKINELFPNSMVQLIPVADKLIVRGQARDAEEATHILSLVRGQGGQASAEAEPGRVNLGSAAEPFPGTSELPPADVINLLHVTGEMQVMLKVRVAELNRSAMREMGVDFTGMDGDFTWESLLGLGGAVRAVLDTKEVQLTVEALKTNSYAKILAEPNLVTLSGHPAAFLAGGEFAVPVVVGVEGASAATTNFRSFGTQLVFTPTVLDRDRIRLEVAPSFSSLDQDIAVNGIPGLENRAVSTTVDLREGQWLAIAGLLQDEQTGSNIRVPFVGDIPVLGTFFSQRENTRNETELIVLVSPELVRPLESEEAPPVLPGMEVTEPSDTAFFLGGRMEGNPFRHYRSTIAAEYLRQRGDARREVKRQGRYLQSEDYYIQGPHGFSP